MARRVGLFTSGELAVFVVAQLIAIGGIVIAVAASPVPGGLTVMVGAVGMMIIGLRLRRRVQSHGHTPRP